MSFSLPVVAVSSAYITSALTTTLTTGMNASLNFPFSAACRCLLGEGCLILQIERIRAITKLQEQDKALELFGAVACTQQDSVEDRLEISPTQVFVPMGADAVTVEKVAPASKVPLLAAAAVRQTISLSSVVMDVSNRVGAVLDPPHSLLTAGALRPPSRGTITPRASLSENWASPVSPHSAEAVRTPAGLSDSDFDITGDENESKANPKPKAEEPSKKRRAGSSPGPDTQLEALLQEKRMSDMMERHVNSLSAQMGNQMTVFQLGLNKSLTALIGNLDSRIDAKIQSSEDRLGQRLDEERRTTERKLAELAVQIKSLASSGSTAAGSSVGWGGGPAPGSPLRRPLHSPTGSPQRSHSEWTSRLGVAYLGGFPQDMPRANIEATLQMMLKGVAGVESAWAPAKLGNSARVQFRSEEEMWQWLKIWKKDGQEQNRFKFGEDFFHVWASKEKSTARKQVDRITRMVGAMLKEEFPEGEMTIQYGKRKVFLLNGANRHVCIAEAAFRSNTWTVQNLQHWVKERDEAGLTLGAQTFED